MAMKPEIRSLVDNIMSFMDYLFGNSNYIIFEKPQYRKRVHWESGYRVGSNREGDKRSHTVNLHLPLIRPSKDEIENFVLRWAEDDENSISLDDLNSVVGDRKDEVFARWHSMVMLFMDKFVQHHLVTARQSGNSNGTIQMGYRQHEDMENTRISMFVSFQVASKKELSAVAMGWVNSYFN